MQICRFVRFIVGRELIVSPELIVGPERFVPLAGGISVRRGLFALRIIVGLFFIRVGRPGDRPEFTRVAGLPWGGVRPAR